ncbi:hypothetical protein GEMRC1_012099 [Eukaryota sp. GEM-RC1]
MQNYNPYGRGGHGAPLQKAEPEVNVVSPPRTYSTSFDRASDNKGHSIFPSQTPEMSSPPRNFMNGVSGMHNGPVDQQALFNKKRQQEQARMELERQMEEKKRREAEQKRKEEEYELKKEREMQNYNPYGRGGHGAPLQKAEPEVNVVSPPRTYSTSFDRASDNKGHSIFPSQTPEMSSPPRNFMNGVSGMHNGPVDQQALFNKKRQQEQARMELERQMEEKKRREAEQKRKEEEYELKKEREMQNYNPYGRGGHGAPLQKAEPDMNVVSPPRNFNTSFNQPQTPSYSPEPSQSSSPTKSFMNGVAELRNGPLDHQSILAKQRQQEQARLEWQQQIDHKRHQKEMERKKERDFDLIQERQANEFNAGLSNHPQNPPMAAPLEVVSVGRSVSNASNHPSTLRHHQEVPRVSHVQNLPTVSLPPPVTQYYNDPGPTRPLFPPPPAPVEQNNPDVVTKDDLRSFYDNIVSLLGNMNAKPPALEQKNVATKDDLQTVSQQLLQLLDEQKKQKAAEEQSKKPSRRSSVVERVSEKKTFHDVPSDHEDDDSRYNDDVYRPSNYPVISKFVEPEPVIHSLPSSRPTTQQSVQMSLDTSSSFVYPESRPGTARTAFNRPNSSDSLRSLRSEISRANKINQRRLELMDSLEEPQEQGKEVPWVKYLTKGTEFTNRPLTANDNLNQSLAVDTDFVYDR